jgi:hypothetical protein
MHDVIEREPTTLRFSVTATFAFGSDAMPALQQKIAPL